MRASLLFVMLSGCAGVRISHADRQLCGTAGTVEVYLQDGALLNCVQATAVTQEALAVLRDKAGVLDDGWQAVYQWTNMPELYAAAQTETDTHTMLMQDRLSRAVLHELFHAWLIEHDISPVRGDNEHGEFCARGWNSVEWEFGGPFTGYCNGGSGT